MISTATQRDNGIDPVSDTLTAMPARAWVFDPNSGGLKIPPALQEETRRRILDRAAEIVPDKVSLVRVWFRGPFCYIDAEEPGSSEPARLCRLRYKGLSGWSLAFYTYSHEKYQPCVFMSGSFTGTPEEAMDIGANYL